MLNHSMLAPTLMLIVSFAHYTLIAKQNLTPSVAFVSYRTIWDMLTNEQTSIAVFGRQFLPLFFLK